ncbi:hypothetical protein KAFR_0H00830 [Kazachstania africana CBS 2517]|uniref:Membrane anchor Opy2 N-terminal domain-containing protein n=1 Tax=Kazachstania africana (strain ATCC 22294 / BCRC 22015 / CBS 2517 / CECT 1963 / NBRC 1671 / NRRL Y-8276) TaxID=1071382 RepID=H2AYT7_KAZAF|nr:hypothetical protein KAFR_0H00830 [Kazachstania africana CBS 2517]CCF59493.1 hypothetical protein KAFR_0H00830 [Kazachstania africana CBS 2517]
MSNSTSSSGDSCVVCTDSVSCPTCGENEYCVMTALTCNECPTTYCATKSSSSLDTLSNSTTTSTSASSTSRSSSTSKTNNNPKIIGGVFGGIFGISLVVLFLAYQWYWKPKYRKSDSKLLDAKSSADLELADDEEDDDFDDFDDDEEEEVPSNMGNFQSNTNGTTAIKTMTMPPPHQQAVRRTTLMNPGDRRSTTSTIRTKASNILPIAYIPGVTSTGLNRPRKFASSNLNVAGDVRSHITLGSSILDFEEEGENDMVDETNKYTNRQNTSKVREKKASQDNLTTAIKARPKLVEITEEMNEEDQEEQENFILRDTIEDIREVTGTTDLISLSREYNGDEDQNSLNDDGSFLLDLEIPDSLRDTSKPDRNVKDPEANVNVESPFDDKFNIDLRDTT